MICLKLAYKWVGAILPLMLITPVASKPNILFIAVDDLNDWIGVMGGHPQAITPNFDRLAAMGVLFNNAQTQAPVCNPSRVSLMSSLYPSTTGIYFLNPDPSSSPMIQVDDLLPKRFEKEGYNVSGAGKLFHSNQSQQHWPNWAGSMGGFGPTPAQKISSFPGHPLWDWGAFPERDDQMPDYNIADWAVQTLENVNQGPFLMGVGFYRPHVPQFAPQKWFDLYPLDSLKLPEVITNDLEDIPEYGVGLTRLEHVAPTQEWVVTNDQWKPLVQSYLACVSFVDAQLGKVLDALEASSHRDSTYIVLFTDHGFHLGEKERWAKRSLWQDGTRTPLMVSGPGIAKGNISGKPVQLLDIYPTLLELTGHAPNPNLEGNSLVPLLKDPEANWPHMARTSFGPGNYSIVSERYRYIHYKDGTEEFYDNKTDPHEWVNLLKNPQYAELIAEHRKHLPQTTYPILGSNSTGHLAFAAAEGLPDPAPYAGCLDSNQLGYNPMAGIHDPTFCLGVPVERSKQLNKFGSYINLTSSGLSWGKTGNFFYIPIPKLKIMEIRLFSLKGKQVAVIEISENKSFIWKAEIPTPLGIYLLLIRAGNQIFNKKVYLLN